jgi:MerR family transcriptional regulator, mercuric resistance operon regulatory protein
MATEGLTIGPLSKRVGLNIETVRYYERAGLLPPPPRTEGGYRVYGDDHLKRLVFIRRGRELGFSLEEIRGLLRMVDGGYTCGEVQSLTLAHLTDIKKKVADLRRLERTLKGVAEQCEGGSITECPVIDALFE